MSEMKMGDVFELPLQLAVNELAIIDKNDCVIGWADAFAGEVARDSIVNAVNNHDRLTEELQAKTDFLALKVAECEKLREALQGMVDQFGEPDGSDFINESDYAVVSNAKKVLFMIEHGLGDEDMQGGNREDVS